MAGLCQRVEYRGRDSHGRGEGVLGILDQGLCRLGHLRLRPHLRGSYVYIAAGAKLLQIDPATGQDRSRGRPGGPIDSIARMVYADGVVVVPLSGGRLQALTADALTTVWVTAKLPANEQGGEQQSLSTLIVKDGCVYFGTAAADWSDSYGGYLVCVDIKTGSVKWKTENADAGYYWAGAAAIGSLLVMGDDTGFVYAVDSQQARAWARAWIWAPVCARRSLRTRTDPRSTWSRWTACCIRCAWARTVS